MVPITKEEAEKIYSTWCSSEDSKFTFGEWEYGLEYDEEEDVAYVDHYGDWVKLTTLDRNSVSVSVAEWVYKEVTGWRD